jgi:hypothetical protein
MGGISIALCLRAAAHTDRRWLWEAMLTGKKPVTRGRILGFVCVPACARTRWKLSTQKNSIARAGQTKVGATHLNGLKLLFAHFDSVVNSLIHRST